MSNKIYLGIDNGVSGSIAIVGNSIAPRFIEIPTISEIDYQKKAKNRTRIDHAKLCDFLAEVKTNADCSGVEIKAFCERPMINPLRFDASISAARAMESLLIALESYHIPYEWCDSRKWQKEMLPSGLQGAPELKKASAVVGTRLFPKFEALIKKHKDADALLIAEYARKNNL